MSDSKRRKRTSLVCENCRRKKVKCDKGQPCGQCVKSGKTATCTYDEEALSQLQNPANLPYLTSAKNPIHLVDQMKGNGHNRRNVNGSTNGQLAYNSTQSPHSYNDVTNRIPLVPLESRYDNATRTELEMLKQRLKSIEQSLGNSDDKNNSNSAPLHFVGFQPLLSRPGSVSTETSKNIPGINGSVGQNYKAAPRGGSNGMSAHSNSDYGTLNNSYTDPKSSFQAAERISEDPYFMGMTSPFPPADAIGKGDVKLPPLNHPVSSIGASTPLGSYPRTPGLNPGGLGAADKRTNSSNNISTGSTHQSFEDFTFLHRSLAQNVDTPYSDRTSNEHINEGNYSDSMRGIHPFGSPDDTINFYEGYSSVYFKEEFRRISFGPFSWSSLMQKDYGLKLLWDHVLQMKGSSANTALIFSNKDSEITAETTSVMTSTTNENSINLDEKVFEKRLLEPEGVSDMIPYYKLKKAQVEKNLEKSKADQSRLPLGLTFYNGKIENELRLIDKIQVFLPKRKVVWKLIHVFFADLYPFMPFLDERCFREEMERMIGPCAYVDEKIEEVKVEKRLDLAFIGILLIMLRISYLSLFTNRNEINEQRLYTKDPETALKAYNYLLSNPITMNVIDVAQECLDQFNLFRKPSVPVIELAFFMKIYHTYAPEDGDGADGGDSSTMLALLTQMAMSVGYHREPDNFREKSDKAYPGDNIGRKIWHYLVLNDLHLAYTFGTPLGISRGSYDTKVPFYREGEEGLIDKELDRFVTGSLFGLAVLYLPLRNILHLILNVEGRTQMSELCKILTEFELLLAKEFGNLTDCITLGDGKYANFTRTYKTKFYLAVKSFYIIVYYYFYLYYEQRNIALSFFYLKKILLISISEFMPHYFDLIGNIRCDLIINPTFEQMIHKSNQIIIAMVIRCNFVIYNMRIKPEHNSKCETDANYLKYYKALCNASSSLTRCLEVSIAVISKISNRYYYAWRITKGHTFLLKTITKKEFYEKNYHKANSLSTPTFSIDQINELIQICEKTLQKLGKDDKNYFSPEIFEEFRPKDDGVKENDRNSGPNITGQAQTPRFFNATGATPFSPEAGMGPSADSYNGRPANGHRESVDEPLKGTPKPSDFDLDFVNSAEIDKLWLQVLTSKQDLEPEAPAPNANVDLNGAGLAENEFDIFSTIPFDQMFETNNQK